MNASLKHLIAARSSCSTRLCMPMGQYRAKLSNVQLAGRLISAAAQGKSAAISMIRLPQMSSNKRHCKPSSLTTTRIWVCEAPNRFATELAQSLEGEFAKSVEKVDPTSRCPSLPEVMKEWVLAARVRTPSIEEDVTDQVSSLPSFCHLRFRHSVDSMHAWNLCRNCHLSRQIRCSDGANTSPMGLPPDVADERSS